MEFVRNWKNGLTVEVVEEPELFGSAGTLRANRPWIASADKFWVFYADVLTRADLNSMLAFHSPQSAATLGVYSVPDPQRCGIVTVGADHVITDFIEKPKAPRNNLAFAGIMIGTPEFLDAIPPKPGADIADLKPLIR